MIAGLSFQVFTLLIFGILGTEYGLRVYRHRNEVLNPSTVDLRRSRKFRLFLGSILVAFVTILTRCAYRIAEMAGGWRNPIMQNQTDFIILDAM